VSAFVWSVKQVHISWLSSSFDAAALDEAEGENGIVEQILLKASMSGISKVTWL
jgi:hypothetical protein